MTRALYRFRDDLAIGRAPRRRSARAAAPRYCGSGTARAAYGGCCSTSTARSSLPRLGDSSSPGPRPGTVASMSRRGRPAAGSTHERGPEQAPRTFRWRLLLRLAERHCDPGGVRVEAHRLVDRRGDAVVRRARRDRWFSSIPQEMRARARREEFAVVVDHRVENLVAVAVSDDPITRPWSGWASGSWCSCSRSCTATSVTARITLRRLRAARLLGDSCRA